MNTSTHCLKQLIIYTAQEYIEDNDVSNEEIMLLDNFADALIQNVEKVLEQK